MVIVKEENNIPAATMIYVSTENRAQSRGQYKKTHIYFHFIKFEILYFFVMFKMILTC